MHPPLRQRISAAWAALRGMSDDFPNFEAREKGIASEKRHEPNQSGSSVFFDLLSNGFEIWLLIVMSGVSMLTELDRNHLLHHALLSLNTIAFVRCADSMRKMSERSEFSTNCWFFCGVRKFKSEENSYELLRKQFHAKMGVYLAFTILNMGFWVLGSYCYAKFQKLEYERHTATVKINDHADGQSEKPQMGAPKGTTKTEFKAPSGWSAWAASGVNWIEDETGIRLDHVTWAALFCAACSSILAGFKVVDAAKPLQQLEPHVFAELMLKAGETTTPATRAQTTTM